VIDKYPRILLFDAMTASMVRLFSSHVLPASRGGEEELLLSEAKRMGFSFESFHTEAFEINGL